MFLKFTQLVVVGFAYLASSLWETFRLNERKAVSVSFASRWRQTFSLEK